VGRLGIFCDQQSRAVPVSSTAGLLTCVRHDLTRAPHAPSAPTGCNGRRCALQLMRATSTAAAMVARHGAASFPVTSGARPYPLHPLLQPDRSTYRCRPHRYEITCSRALFRFSSPSMAATANPLDPRARARPCVRVLLPPLRMDPPTGPIAATSRDWSRWRWSNAAIAIIPAVSSSDPRRPYGGSLADDPVSSQHPLRVGLSTSHPFFASRPAPFSRESSAFTWAGLVQHTLPFGIRPVRRSVRLLVAALRRSISPRLTAIVLPAAPVSEQHYRIHRRGT